MVITIMVLTPVSLAFRKPIITEQLVVASERPIEKKVVTIPSLIDKYSQKYGVPYKEIHTIIACETGNTFNPEIQSRVRYNFSSTKRGIVKGERERSYGLAQIHLPDHPYVSIEQAKDPEFAIEFMAKSLSKGKNIWYCGK